jgi:polysaccharide biosynthesis protein PslH
MRVLVLSSWWPEPMDNGSRLRIGHLLRALAASHELHLLALAQEPISDEQHATALGYCASAAAVPERRWTRQRGEILASLWTGIPSSARATYNSEFAAIVRAWAARLKPDLVLALQFSAAPYARLVPDVPRVLEELEVQRLRDQYRSHWNPARRLRAYLTWWQHCRYLRRLLRDFDACTVVSQPEAELLRRIAPTMPIAVIPNGAEIRAATGWGAAEADTLIYPGALSFDANFDAMAYFLGGSFPLIRAERPQTRLRITGRADEAQRAALHTAGVEWTGYVADVRPLIARSWCEVVPLRAGGGTRLKVLEALALGTPVVATSKGVEGLELRHDEHVLIADTLRSFADATLRLLSQPSLRARLAAAGQGLVRDRYDWRRIGGRLDDLLLATAKGLLV